jgi:peptide/nickel transport system substrate-binding protein
VTVGIATFVSAGILAAVGFTTTAVSLASSAGRTVSFALPPNSIPDEIFPLDSLPGNVNLFDLQYLLYRPLYWFGQGGTPFFNARYSIADAPVYSNGGRTATVTLKNYMWSDGAAVTNRDVEFWMNLLIANKADWFDYVPGYFPDNIVSMSYPASKPLQFSITFNRAYNHEWLLYNEFSQILPLPQQSWDRTSGTSRDSNFDLTPTGARAVYAYLDAASKNLSSYVSNPLWRVTDGPWILTSYAPSTGFSGFSPNPRYSGPRTGNVSKFDELPFTSDAAEFDAVRSGQVDYGYLPTEDLSQEKELEANGRKLAKWPPWGFNGIELNYTNPVVGSILKQLYVRQALEHLIDQPQIVKDIFHGTAFPTYGPVPLLPKNPLTTSVERHDPYPYSVKAAVSLLTGHGWTIHPKGVDVCSRPGSAANECGAGVKRGAKLSFTMQYLNGSAPFTAMNEVMQSAWSLAGISLQLKSGTFAIYGTSVPCNPRTGAGCQWQITNLGAPGSTATYSPYYYPTGETLFATNSESNTEGYSNPTMDRYITATTTEQGTRPFAEYENFAARQLPLLWEPDYYVQISVISSKLHGTTPQNPNLNINPEEWTVS